MVLIEFLRNDKRRHRFQCILIFGDGLLALGSMVRCACRSLAEHQLEVFPALNIETIRTSPM